MLKTKKPPKSKKVQQRKSKKPIPSPTSFLPDESISSAPDYPYLLKSLENAAPGQLFFLQINSPLKRKHLPELLESDGLKRPYAIADFAVLPKDVPPYQVLREFLEDCGPCEILYVDGLEHIIEASQKIGGALEALVMGREILASLGVAVVFLLPLYLMNLIRNHALNLWIWRAHDYNLDTLETSSPSINAIPSFGTHTVARNDTPESRERRIRILQRLLDEGVKENRSMESLVQTALLPLADDLYDAGRYEETHAILFEALNSLDPAESLSDIMDLSGRMANVLLAQGKYNEAEPILLQALEMSKQLLGDQHPSVAASLNNLASLYESQGRYAEAEPLYLQALEMNKQLLGGQHPSVATSLNNLAALYESQGRYAEAEPLYLQALEMSKQLLGDQHPDVATSLNNLALLYNSQGRSAEAEPLYLQALEMRKKLLGDQHPDVAASLNNLAGLYASQGRSAEAEPLYLQALEMRKQLLGDQHPDVAASLNNLALLYNSQGRYAEAEPLMANALKLCQELLGRNHPYTIRFSQSLQAIRKKTSAINP